MKSSFQMILLSVLGFIAFVAILMFAGILPGGSGFSGNQAVAEVTMWGPYGGEALNNYFGLLNKENEQVVTIKYVPQVPETYENNLIESFARGEGPDLFIANQRMLNRLAGKITEIPYSIYPQRDVINNFADGVSVFMNSKGLRVMPLMIDPLVMFYNRTMYTSAGVVIPPKNWTEFLATIKPIVEIDTRNNITRTAGALGEFRNITNAKYILSALMFQAGNPVITTNADDNYKTVLAESFGYSPIPAVASLAFFQQFSNPAQVSYAWNRSMPNDKDFFVAEKSATYFGLASELADLQAKNPHLNLDVVILPQKDMQKRVTFANFYGVVIAKSSKKQNAAATASMLLAQAKNQTELAKILGFIPASRSVLATKDSNPFTQVFKDSAVISRSWVDPDRNSTNEIFQQVVENVQTGQVNPDSAIREANEKISRLFNPVSKSSAP